MVVANNGLRLGDVAVFSRKLSYEVLQPPLRKTAVSGSAFYPDIYLPNGNLFTPQIIKVEKTKHKTLVIGIPIIGLIKA